MSVPRASGISSKPLLNYGPLNPPTRLMKNHASACGCRAKTTDAMKKNHAIRAARILHGTRGNGEDHGVIKALLKVKAK